MRKIIISDPTLRDGNHAISHQLTLTDVQVYTSAIDAAGIDLIEVGHGNGLGASSLLLGKAKVSDIDMIKTAYQELSNAKLSIHIIPGFGLMERDLKPAIEAGVQVFRIASHCTEADTTQRHIEYIRKQGKEAVGTLMMSHMADKETLLSEAKKMVGYGADAIVLMDSAGAYLPQDTHAKISYLVDNLDVAIGFHAHNNLGLAVANSIQAAQSGATILDGTARGFGGGAGNTQLEVMVALLHKLGFQTNIDLYKLLDAVEQAENLFIKQLPTISSTSLLSGLYGVVSVFSKPVTRIAKKYKVDQRDILRILGQRGVIAGQEDLILEVAEELSKNTSQQTIAEIELL